MPAAGAGGSRRERRAAPRREHRGPVAVSMGGKVLRCEDTLVKVGDEPHRS